jgi:predicted NBD/HSP70 family sugar kinase
LHRSRSPLRLRRSEARIGVICQLINQADLSLTARALPRKIAGGRQEKTVTYLEGSTQGSPRLGFGSGIRAQNERLVMSLVRRHGALAKSEIARLTGLSAQTVSVIMRQLEAEDLLLRGEPLRGRVGQPSVPHSINPDGAFFLGAKVGRRSLDVVLVDFLGTIRHRESVGYAFPQPEQTIARITAAARGSAARLGALGNRIAGLGLAMPFELWSWAEAMGAPKAEIAAWRDVDIRAVLAEALPHPVYLQNDATAACGAELVFGSGAELQNFLYFFVGSFVGGGVVLNGSLHSGPTGNAGALGSIPVPAPGGGTEQLIEQASLAVLERRLRAAGKPAEILYAEDGDWACLGVDYEAWLATSARGLAHAIIAGTAILDCDAVVIDGTFPRAVQTRLLAAVEAEVARLDTAGIRPPALRAGSLGAVARALGGAALPLFARYLIDQNMLVRGRE